MTQPTMVQIQGAVVVMPLEEYNKIRQTPVQCIPSRWDSAANCAIIRLVLGARRGWRPGFGRENPAKSGPPSNSVVQTGDFARSDDFSRSKRGQSD